MTNEMIVLWESVKLMEQGILQGTGDKVLVKDKNGEQKELEMPEEIHTFARWKELGFMVQKGEHAVAKFPIWKHSGAKTETLPMQDGNDVEYIDSGKMFLKTAAFFTRGQVAPLEKK